MKTSTKRIMFMGSTTKLEGDAEIRSELQLLIDKYGNERTALKPILHDLQEKYHGIPDKHMQILADMLRLHAIEVQEVVSFYSFYNTGKKGKYIVRMCKTMPCKMAGAKEVAEQFEKILGIKFGETTADEKFTLEWTSCIGMC
ncbi:MAG: NAD(P)H-dependent oxidoreductase subunit E, partial [Gammaproteobacteria bacterium]|nr:NAD(P)H-dependent oxidoreductase subunit E [Gammaproteobacteria bacterium]